jgi:hypothetical protein
MNDESIFVQIASYRDPELVPTILDMFETADNPEQLHVCICWQHDDIENLSVFNNYPNINIIDVPYQKSKGACWARNLIQRYYNGEKYTLQLDSHHRFVQGWDTSLKLMYAQCVEMGSKKPLITTYVPAFDPFESKDTFDQTPWRMDFHKFTDEGTLIFTPSPILNHEKLTRPIPARFYSAHFAFAAGTFCEEVSHDPEYYFYGEEISIAVRAFTHGYDLYHPHKVIAWHEYTRQSRIKHWDDHDLSKFVNVDKSWWERDASSHKRNRVLFGLEEDDSIVIAPKYRMGSVRSVTDYEKYAGLNFKDQSVSVYTLSGKTAPAPYTQNYVCGKTSHSADIKSVNKSVKLESSYVNDNNISYVKLEIYDSTHRLMMSQSLSKKLIELTNQGGVDAINISINFEIIVETNYYCKLYVYDTFDRITTQTTINL